MDAILQMTLWHAFSWMKVFEFWLKFHWRLSLRVLLNNIPGLVQIMAWSRPGNKPLSEQIMVILLTHYASLGLNELIRCTSHVLSYLWHSSREFVSRGWSEFANLCFHLFLGVWSTVWWIRCTQIRTDSSCRVYYIWKTMHHQSSLFFHQTICNHYIDWS